MSEIDLAITANSDPLVATLREASASVTTAVAEMKASFAELSESVEGGVGGAFTKLKSTISGALEFTGVAAGIEIFREFSEVVSEIYRARSAALDTFRRARRHDDATASDGTRS